jgi:hypothetical protein
MYSPPIPFSEALDRWSTTGQRPPFSFAGHTVRVPSGVDLPEELHRVAAECSQEDVAKEINAALIPWIVPEENHRITDKKLTLLMGVARDSGNQESAGHFLVVLQTPAFVGMRQDSKQPLIHKAVNMLHEWTAKPDFATWTDVQKDDATKLARWAFVECVEKSWKRELGPVLAVLGVPMRFSPQGDMSLPDNTL